jgi:glycosyltransferase involved in cell wall biosynthesis
MPDRPGGRPRLAYVAHTLNPGGTERLAVDMALAFRSRYQVQVICLDEPGLWAGELRAQGIPVHCLWRQDGFDPGVVARLAARLRSDRVDLVHAHQCTPWFYAALARLLHGRPRLLLEEHGRFHPEISKSLRILVNRLLIRRLTHMFVAVSSDIRERLVTYEGLARDTIRVVYNGTRPVPTLAPGDRAALRRELGYSGDDFVIGAIGRLDPIKNLPLLVRAFGILRQRHRNLRLLIVGEGPERHRIEALVRECGLASSVQLTGFRNDTRRLMGAIDLFAMASFSEGTSMAILEAMSAGLPIVVSAVGGNPEVIRHGQTGLLFPSDDVDALVEAIDRLCADSVLRQGFSGAVQEDFGARFSFDAMIDSYARIYRELLGGVA